VSRRASVLQRLDASTPVVALIAILAMVAGLSLLGNSFSLEREAITMLVYVVIVVGLYDFVGISGVLSFGHITFVTVGAYVTAFATMPPAIKHAAFSKMPDFVADLQVSPLMGLLFAGLGATVVALVIAVPINRLPGVTLGLAMFALLLTSNIVAAQGTALMTGGQTSVFGIPKATTLFVAFVFASITIVVSYLYQQSRAGLILRAAREDEHAARASGISIARSRFSAFLLSAFVLGVGGGLFVQFLGTLNPSTFFFETTLTTLAMLVVGGIGSLSGAVLGAVVLSVVLAWLRELENGFELLGSAIPARPGLTSVGLAVVMLLILMRRPQGLTKSREIPPASIWRLPRFRDSGSGSRDAAPQPEAIVTTEREHT
jgi:branched-chain amino acid transport system permease protein